MHLLQAGRLVLSIYGGLCAQRQGGQGLPAVLPVQVLCDGLALADDLVGLGQCVAQRAPIGVNIRLQALLGHLVVPLAHGVVDLRHGVLQCGGEAVERLGHGLHGSTIHGFHAGLDDVHGLLAADLPLGDHVVDLPLGFPHGVGQHADHIHAPLLEDIQIFQGRLAAALHPGHGLGHIVHVVRGDAHGAPRVANGLNQLQHPLRGIPESGGQ